MLLFEMTVVFGIAVLNERVVKLGAKAAVAVWGLYQGLKEMKKNLHFDITLIENEENRLIHSKCIVTIRKLISIFIYGFCIVQLIEISNRNVWIAMVNQLVKNTSIWNELSALRLLNLELIVVMIASILMNFIDILLYQIKREYLLFNPIIKSILFVIFMATIFIILATHIQQFCWMFL